MKVTALLFGLLLVCAMAAAEEPVAAPVRDVHPMPAVLKEILAHKFTTAFDNKSVDETIQCLREETGASIIGIPFTGLQFINLDNEPPPVFAARRGESVQQLLEEMGLECRYIDSAVFLYWKQQFTTRPKPGVPPPPLAGDALKTFDAALQNLRSADFEERETASNSIEALGEAAATSIQIALKSEDDPEARQRLEKLLALYARETLDDFDPETSLQLDKVTSKVTIDLDDVSLNDTETLRQIKLPITWDILEIKSPRRLRFHVREMPAGDAIRWLAHESGTQIVPTADGFKLVTRLVFKKK